MQWTNGAQRNTPLMIPWQGPFHVSLNTEESTVQVFWPVFEKLYKALFGRLVNRKYMFDVTNTGFFLY